MTSLPSSRRAVFWGLFVLCLAVRAAACRQTRLVSTDGVTFFYMAQEIVRGDWASALAQDQHPLYPAWLAVFYGATGHPQVAFAASMLAASALLFILIWRVSGRLLGGEAAVWTAFLFSVHPLFVRNAADFLSETPTLVLVAAGVLALVRWLEAPSVRQEAVLGIVSGLGYLVRQEAIEILLGACVILMIRWGCGRLSARQAARAAFVSTVAFLLVVGPYLSYLRTHEGFWMISRKKGFFALFPWLDPSYGIHPAVPFPDGTGVILAVRAWIYRLDFWYGFQKSVVGAFHPLFLLLAAGGGWLVWRRPFPASSRGPAGLVLGTFLALHAAVLLVLYNGAGYMEKRHALLAILVSLPCAGFCLACVASRWAPGKWSKAFLAVVLAAVFLLQALKPRREDFMGRGVYMAVGESIAGNPGVRGVLAAPKGRAGQWIAWSAVAASRRGGAERPLGMALFEPGGGRLPLTVELLSRCGAVVCDAETWNRHADVLSGWSGIDRWTIGPDGEKAETWTVLVPSGSMR